MTEMTKENIPSFIQKEAGKFLDTLMTHDIISLLRNIDQEWYIDHIAYRFATDEAYQNFKSAIQQSSATTLSSENNSVNWRPISIIRHPIHYNDSIIQCLELIAPKPHKQSVQWFQHIEIVTEMNDTLKEILKSFTIKNENRSFEEKQSNQWTAEYVLQQHQTWYEITFHGQDIKDIIAEEISKSEEKNRKKSMSKFDI